tara:strand:- start:513 stop:665 length:153 start_codon:yes stop_codon:yes gene_type:complete
MLSIGRALMTNSKLLILDEATEGRFLFDTKRDLECAGNFKEVGLIHYYSR